MIRHIVLLTMLLTFLFQHGNAQQSELEKRNGFKDIKLGSIVDSVKGVKFKKDFKENDSPVKLYSVEHPNYANIGEIKVNKIELKVYKNNIFEILVVTQKDSRLMKAMESALGRAEYDARNDIYFWKGENLSLTFQSHSKNELQLTYKSYSILKTMKEDKEKKVDDISKDF